MGVDLGLVERVGGHFCSRHRSDDLPCCPRRRRRPRSPSLQNHGSRFKKKKERQSPTHQPIPPTHQRTYTTHQAAPSPSRTTPQPQGRQRPPQTTAPSPLPPRCPYWLWPSPAGARCRGRAGRSPPPARGPVFERDLVFEVGCLGGLMMWVCVSMDEWVDGWLRRPVDSIQGKCRSTYPPPKYTTDSINPTIHLLQQPRDLLPLPHRLRLQRRHPQAQLCFAPLLRLRHFFFSVGRSVCVVGEGGGVWSVDLNAGDARQRERGRFDCGVGFDASVGREWVAVA